MCTTDSMVKLGASTLIPTSIGCWQPARHVRPPSNLAGQEKQPLRVAQATSNHQATCGRGGAELRLEKQRSIALGQTGSSCCVASSLAHFVSRANRLFGVSKLQRMRTREYALGAAHALWNPHSVQQTTAALQMYASPSVFRGWGWNSH